MVLILSNASEAKLAEFREKWGLSARDEIYGFVGRLGEEKNLPVLIKAMDKVGRERPHAKLVLWVTLSIRRHWRKWLPESGIP